MKAAVAGWHKSYTFKMQFVDQSINDPFQIVIVHQIIRWVVFLPCRQITLACHCNAQVSALIRQFLARR